MTARMTLTINGRSLPIAMQLDPSVPTDAAMNYYLSRQTIPEPEVVLLLGRVLREGDLVIDGGANIGFFTILMSRLVGDTGRVIAVEPGQNNVHRLKTNIELNELHNVQVEEKVLADKIGEVDFHLAIDGGLNSCWPAENEVLKQRLPATTLFALCDNFRPRLIKLDIEGAEVNACRSIPRLFAPFIVAEMNPIALAKMNESSESLRSQMALIGYEIFLLHDDGRLPSRVPGNTSLVIERQNTNVLFSTFDAIAEAWPEVTP